MHILTTEGICRYSLNSELLSSVRGNGIPHRAKTILVCNSTLLVPITIQIVVLYGEYSILPIPLLNAQ